MCVNFRRMNNSSINNAFKAMRILQVLKYTQCNIHCLIAGTCLLVDYQVLISKGTFGQ